MLDLLSLTAAVAKSHRSPSTEEEDVQPQDMDVTNGGGERESKGDECGLKPQSPLLVSWERLRYLIGYTFDEACQHHGCHLLHCLEHLHDIKSSIPFDSRGEGKADIFDMLCVQLWRTMSTLLTAMSCEELQVSLEQLLPVVKVTAAMRYGYGRGEGVGPVVMATTLTPLSHIRYT